MSSYTCSPKLEHLKRVTLADLALDTDVYNGHTTASDMLWAGVPFITLAGDGWPSLVASSCAKAVGMPEMIVHSLREYEERAVQLAKSPEAVLELKAKLARKRETAPLFDTSAWVLDFEVGLDEAWRRFAENDLVKEDLVVNDVDATSLGRARARLPQGARASTSTAAETPPKGASTAAGDKVARKAIGAAASGASAAAAVWPGSARGGVSAGLSGETATAGRGAPAKKVLVKDPLAPHVASHTSRCDLCNMDFRSPQALLG